MACCLFGTKPLSKPMVTNQWENPSLKIVIVFIDNSPSQLCWCVGSSVSHLFVSVSDTRCQGFPLLGAVPAELLGSNGRSSTPKTGPPAGAASGELHELLPVPPAPDDVQDNGRQPNGPDHHYAAAPRLHFGSQGWPMHHLPRNQQACFAIRCCVSQMLQKWINILFLLAMIIVGKLCTVAENDLVPMITKSSAATMSWISIVTNLYKNYCKNKGHTFGHFTAMYKFF